MFGVTTSGVVLFILIVSQLFLSNVRGFDFVNSNRKLLFKCILIFSICLGIVFLFKTVSLVEYAKLMALAGSVFIYYLFSLLLKRISQNLQKTDFSIEMRPQRESYFGDDKGYTYLDNFLTSIIMTGSVIIPTLFYYLLFEL